MANIFIALYNGVDVNNLSRLPCFYETFINGLRNAGNAVMVETTNIWNFKKTKCPHQLATAIKNFNPDICFLFNNCFYDISNLVECPIVIYEVDSFLFYQNKEVLYKNPNRFYYFVPQTCSFDVLQNELHVDKRRICYVPFFTDVHSDATEPMVNNICFVGSKFTNGDRDSVVREFMLLNPNHAEKQQFKSCLEVIVKNPYVSVSDIEKQVGTLFDKVRSMITNVHLIGYLSDVRRIKGLSSVAPLGLSLYGTKNWLNDLAYDDNLLLSYNPQRIVSLNDTQTLYNSHKIGININNIQAQTGFGWRVADIMASNACLVSEFKPDFAHLFPGVKIPFFESPDDAYDVCKKLLENENMRLDIVAQCQNVINQKYRFEHTLQIIGSFLGINLRRTPKSGDNQVIFLPPLKAHSPGKITIRIKQIIYSLMLFIASLPPIPFLTQGKLQAKIKVKLNRYI